jgi:hypothetical protein
MGIILSMLKDNKSSYDFNSSLSKSQFKLDLNEEIILKNIFICLYSVAKTHNLETYNLETLKNNLKQFINSILFLSSNLTLIGEINLLSIDNFLDNNDSLFLWVFIIHSAFLDSLSQNTKSNGLINIKMKTLDFNLVEDLFSLQKLTKELWSHAFWDLIHHFAIIVDLKINEHVEGEYCNKEYSGSDYRNQYKIFLQSLSIFLPCHICRQHIGEYNFNFDNIKNFFEYSVKLHNNVNLKLNYPIFNLEDAKLKYISKIKY